MSNEMFHLKKMKQSGALPFNLNLWVSYRVFQIFVFIVVVFFFSQMYMQPEDYILFSITHLFLEQINNKGV